MNHILSLLEIYDEVWIYVPDEYREQFLQELIDMDAHFISGTPAKKITLRENIRLQIGVDRNREVGYISNICWCGSFSSSTSKAKIHYGRYVTGDKNYVITNPDLVPISPKELLQGNITPISIEDLLQEKTNESL